MKGYLSTPQEITFCVATSTTFQVLVPTTWETMERGLQGFPPPGPREGMLFRSRTLPKDEHIPMHMAKVQVPLDMVWLGANGRVVAIEREVQPGDARTYSYLALACLEIRGGSCSVLGIRVGTAWVSGRGC